MKGLEISEVSLKGALLDNATFRIDPEYFKKEYTHFSPCGLNVKSLSYFVESGYRVVYGNTEVLNPKFAKPGGAPFFLQAVDIQTPFIDSDNLKYVCEGDWDKYPQGRIKRGELLIEVKGRLEKVAVVPKDFPEHTLVSGTLYKMTINDKISKYVILAYLISKFGVSFKNRYKTNLLVSYISKDDLYRIPVPEFSKRLQDRVDAIFSEIFANQEAAKVAYYAAEQILLSELGFDGWTPKEESVSVKNCSDFMSAGRFDAEYFQPKYDEIVAKLKTYLGGTIKATSVLVTGLVNESEDIPERYVELADIGVSGEIAGCTDAMFGELPSRARQRMATGQVIASSIEGSLDRCALVTPEYDKALCSTGFHRFSSQDINPETMLLLFKSWPIQQLMKRGCSGTILCGILPTALEHVDLPVVNPQVQKVLAAKVRESFALRAESKRLLDLAKHAVEVAIEQGEDKAIKSLGADYQYDIEEV